MEDITHGQLALILIGTIGVLLTAIAGYSRVIDKIYQGDEAILAGRNRIYDKISGLDQKFVCRSEFNEINKRIELTINGLIESQRQMNDRVDKLLQIIAETHKINV